MLVTPDGRWVLADSVEFLAALGDPAPDYDAPSFAVRNLGFVKFQSLGTSLIEVELHPENVALPALLAVQQQLLSSSVRLFRIKYFDRSWNSEITSRPSEQLRAYLNCVLETLRRHPANDFRSSCATIRTC